MGLGEGGAQAVTPQPDQMRLAAMWLRHNEADPGTEERDSCQAVAAWLEGQADARDLRETCRAAGVPVAKVRKRIGQTP